MNINLPQIITLGGWEGKCAGRWPSELIFPYEEVNILKQKQSRNSIIGKLLRNMKGNRRRNDEKN